VEFLKLSDLEGLTDDQIEQKMRPIIQGSLVPPNGSVDCLAAKIGEYERAYQCPQMKCFPKFHQESCKNFKTLQIGQLSISC